MNKEPIEVDYRSQDSKSLEALLQGSKFYDALQELKPSRQVSLAITKVEEALHWLKEITPEQDNG